MRIRAATDADLPTLEQLWRAFEVEVPEPRWLDADPDAELSEIAEIVEHEIALLAEDDDGSPLGFALARKAGSRLGRLTDVYVEPAARRSGVARALVHEAVTRLRDQGAEFVRLEVVASNKDARAVYARWGFRDDELTLVAPLDALLQRLTPSRGDSAEGVVFVQTDDVAAVERAVAAFVPRIGSHESRVDEPANGWTAVRDAVASRDPAALRRLAKELSDRLGAVVLSLGIEAGGGVLAVRPPRWGGLGEGILGAQVPRAPAPGGPPLLSA